ncbi:MAG TPA: class I SAM-dependent methyltransferase [Solirubrobacteraceae bacterium]|nr:class I SAM-dependent methyltransferase [Solirubrobacteraceae bacterium]
MTCLSGVLARAGFPRIGPTAHYTGYVWARNGLSHPELETREGRVLFDSLQPWMLASRATGGATLEAYLLARHRAIDFLLEQAIERDGVSQVIEVASGLSPRGWRFTQRYGDRLVYVEADLPEMAARKRAALERMGSLGEHHRVAQVDALRGDDGPGSLAAIVARLDTGHGLAIITEGLLGYLSTDAVEGLWRRFAATLGAFPSGRYISDVHLGGALTAQVRVFRVMLSAFVRGRVYLHFSDAPEAEAALVAAGFGAARVTPAADVAGDDHRERGSRLANILEASINLPPEASTA